MSAASHYDQALFAKTGRYRVILQNLIETKFILISNWMGSLLEAHVYCLKFHDGKKMRDKCNKT